MIQKSKQFWKDWSERLLWTLAQAGLGLVSVEMLDLPLWAVPLVAAGLSAAKGIVARKIGNPDSASTVPTV